MVEGGYCRAVVIVGWRLSSVLSVWLASRLRWDSLARCRSWCRLHVALVMSSASLGERGFDENEVRQKSYFVFLTHLSGLPLPGSPLAFLTPPFPCRATTSRLHSFGKGRGSSDSVLASEGADELFGPHPSI